MIPSDASPPHPSDKTPWKLCPDFAKATTAIYAARSVTPTIPATATMIRRQMLNATSKMLRYTRRVTLDPRVQKKSYTFPSSLDHEPITIIHYFRSDVSPGDPPTAALLHCHAGGFMSGSVEIFEEGPLLHVGETAIPWFSVEFRLAPERKHPTQLQDCYDGLTWLYAHTAEFNVDRRRIAIMGESSGGALAVGVAMKARDAKLTPPLCRTILIYPMLDDRNLEADPKIEPYATWTAEDTRCAWMSVLNEQPGSAEVPVLAAPGRAEVADLRGLPKMYVEIGLIDSFRDSTIEFVQKLIKAGVAVDFHLIDGMVHAAEFVVPETPQSQANLARRQAMFTSL